ncbi:UDP-N-acetylglucosamine 1-carboxyvinyltransferase [Candidatus Peregrinibacteria bacterium]|nr:UDP-N-acetylglucosamine 1-carboxyvinyltransferase [Candidatus Peregrinibacteria bacterium]
MKAIHMPKYIVKGGKKLHGSIQISGSKNAALPILCATLLAKKPVTLKNIPNIADIHAMISILRTIGADIEYRDKTITVDTKNVKNQYISNEGKHCMRASILLLGPLMARFKKAKMAFPGGCILGKRPVDTHLYALEALGAEVIDAKQDIEMKTDGLRGDDVVMSELSVTATENAIMAAVTARGKTIIRLAAAEPHVQDLCHFLNSIGADITGIGTHTLVINGVNSLQGGEYAITGDYLEAGTFIIAAVLTNGDVTVQGIDPHHLDSFWQKLSEVGASYELKDNAAHIKPHGTLKAVGQLRTAVHPSFPTDLQAPFAVLLTQAQGDSKIFETLFDGRLNYLAELEKMGAKFEMLNPHQAIISGKTKLKGVPISSWDIRAGAAMVLAALVAKGETEISNIGFIDRGYDNLEAKLQKLGAEIERV